MSKVTGFIDILIGLFLISSTFVFLYPYSKLLPLYSTSGMTLLASSTAIVVASGLIMTLLSLINFVLGCILIGLLATEVISPIYNLTNSLSNH